MTHRVMVSILKLLQPKKWSLPINRLMRGAGWGIMAALVGQGISLASTALVARSLGREAYGQFVMIQGTLMMFGLFAGFGVGATASRYVAALRNSDQLRLRRILTLCGRSALLFGSVVSLLMLVFAAPIANRVLRTPELTMPLALAAVTVLFSAFDGYQKSILVGLEAMRSYAISAIGGALIAMPLLLGLVYFHGLAGAAAGLAFGSLTQAILTFALARRESMRAGIFGGADNCLEELAVLRDFALPALMAGAMVTPAHWICQAMLANTSNGFAEVAMLGIAMQWFNAALLLPNTLSRVMTPILTQYVVANKAASSAKIIIASSLTNLLVSLIVVGAVALLSNKILLAYGQGFENGAATLTLAALAAIVVAVVSPVGNLLVAKSKMWVGLAMNFAWFICYVTLAYFLVDLGAKGVVMAMGFAYLLHSGWVLLWTVRNFNEGR